MKDIMGMMGKLKDVQSKMQNMQEEIAAMEAEGVSGGGLVKVTLAGKGQMVSVVVDPSLMKEEEAEILEDLLVAAHNDAKTKLDEVIAKKTQEITAGLPIPPGMKLPF